MTGFIEIHTEDRRLGWIEGNPQLAGLTYSWEAQEQMHLIKLPIRQVGDSRAIHVTEVALHTLRLLPAFIEDKP